MSFENEIRDLAYSKWEAAGCPETTLEERNHFWYEAEQQVLSRCANKMFTPKLMPIENVTFEPIPGAECLGEIDDVTYFKNKLLQGMSYPNEVLWKFAESDSDSKPPEAVVVPEIISFYSFRR
jgi:hypothetical protein